MGVESGVWREEIGAISCRSANIAQLQLAALRNTWYGKQFQQKLFCCYLYLEA